MAYFRSPFDDDPFFNSRPSFIMEPPHMMGPPMMMADPHYRRSQGQQLMSVPHRGSMLTPFGGGGFMDPFRHMESMMSNFHRVMEEGPPSGSSYSSSTVMQFSSSTGRDGRPQIYQSSSSTRRAPGGIEESRKMERDSTSGIQKMSVSHKIGDKSRTVEKKVNVKTNEREENHELINISEDEEHTFNKEWDSKTHSVGHHQLGGRRHRAEARGLPMATGSTHTERPHPEHSPPVYQRMHPYTRAEGGVVNDEAGKRKKKIPKEVHF